MYQVVSSKTCVCVVPSGDCNEALACVLYSGQLPRMHTATASGGGVGVGGLGNGLGGGLEAVSHKSWSSNRSGGMINTGVVAHSRPLQHGRVSQRSASAAQGCGGGGDGGDGGDGGAGGGEGDARGGGGLGGTGGGAGGAGER